MSGAKIDSVDASLLSYRFDEPVAAAMLSGWSG
jgi:hypothetical protein